MASLIKIKRSNVAAKRPTTSDIAAGELALNTKDKRAFSSDGGVVFEIGANVHSLSVGSGAFSIANGAITFPTSDGSVGQVLSTDGSGTLSFSSISSSSLADGAVTRSKVTSDIVANTYLQPLIANTNTWITAVETREAAHTANTLLHLANTNSYIATKVSTSTFNSALANTNSYIATVQSDVDSNEATERAALANTNSYIATKANIASPTFTGVPAAPTASAGTNTTQIATTAFVRTEVTNLIDSAPTTLDTLNELAAALGDDPNFATTIASTYQTKSVERAALANTNSYIATKLSSSSYTAADVLSKLLTVDGAGTGLDADTLDGVQGASYLRSDTADTFSGAVLRVDNDAGIDVTNTGQINGLQIYQSTAGADALISFHVVGDFAMHFGLDADTNDLTVGGWSKGANKYKIWHAGNDGSGSGLDADTLDGVQGSSFLRSDTADTATGQIFFDAGFDAHPIMLSGAQNFDNIDRSGFYNLYNTQTSSTNSPPLDYGTMIVVGNDKGTSGFGLQIAHERTGGGFYVRGMNDTGSTWYDWDEIWTSGTDGSGSGLDADLLDGVQGASYLRSDADDSFSGAITGTGSISISGLIRTTGSGYTVHLGTDAGGSVSLGRTDNVASTPYIDFNSGATSVDYDARIQATGGSGSSGGGTLNVEAGSFNITGAFTATTKSFVIDHPTKEGMKLRYGSLEGPENGVYVRGRLKDNNVIELPDYWTGLVDEDTITVNLTAIGKSQNLYVADIKDNKVYVKGSRQINCFYTVFGERKDVDKLEVEYESE